MPSTTTDRTPLLSGSTAGPVRRTLCVRFSGLFRRSTERSWLELYRRLFRRSWLNILLVFVPLSILASQLEWRPELQFAFSTLAIVPLSALLGNTTDQLSSCLGDALAGLVGATFGNIVEIVVGISALLREEYRIVQTALLGSILNNLVFVLGCSFFAAGFRYCESNFQTTAAQTSGSLMTLACIMLVIPAAYHTALLAECPHLDCDDQILPGLRIISRGTSIIILLVYAAQLVFQLKTHAYMYESNRGDSGAPMKQTPAAALALVVLSLIVSICADNLVASINGTVARYNLSKTFMGAILLPIVGNAAQWLTAVRMAINNKMEGCIAISVGSAIQVAAFVIPLLVTIGWCTNHDLTLFFANFETIVLFVSVLLVSLLIQDGKSNFMEGLMLIALYLVIALAFWVS
ncbi:hypothetical protein CERSUDRAFT_116024 [Gelatoporia subvermispora B]|uniref:Vacuolar calcium ion transporter n=1 Tax=Ceriporiopsis subvermispora (strain B) TaxID=914234 RepID=M2PIW2_CERS8|nr:hypothetical protein CERSUDRAFT_116024 [Gelatoporia subvermispora B]